MNWRAIYVLDQDIILNSLESLEWKEQSTIPSDHSSSQTLPDRNSTKKVLPNCLLFIIAQIMLQYHNQFLNVRSTFYVMQTLLNILGFLTSSTIFYHK